MKKIKPERLTKKEIFKKDAINKIFEIAGHDFDYEKVMESEYKQQVGLLPNTPEYDWYEIYTWSAWQKENYKKWFINEYCKRFKKNKSKGDDSGESIVKMYLDLYGLREVE